MAVRKDVKELTLAVKELAKQEGAVLVGIGNVERWEGAPRGHGPKDFVPEAKSVISIAQPILNAVIEVATLEDKEVDYVPPKFLRAYLEDVYNVMGHRVQDYMLEHIGQVVGQYLQEKGYYTMIFPTMASNQLPGLTYEESTKIWEGEGGGIPASLTPYGFFGYIFGSLSHRHAAVRCGLGEFGYNNVVLTRQFGPRQRFNSIVTEAELEPDPLVTKPICLRDKCNLCLKACPTGAIRLKESFDKDKIFIDTPSRTDPRLCVPRRICFYGDCNRVCPIGKPKYLSKRLKALKMGPIGKLYPKNQFT